MELPVPLAFFESAIWRNPAWGRIYLDWQARAAASASEDLAFSVHAEAERYGVTRWTVRALVAHLEERNLVLFPNGTGFRSAYPMRLTPRWANGEAPPKLSAQAAAHTAAQEESRQDAGSGNGAAQELAQGAAQNPPKKRRRASTHERVVQEPIPLPLPPMGAGQEQEAGEKPSGDKSPAADGGADGQIDRRHPVHRLMELLVVIGYNGHQLTGKPYGEQAAAIKRMVEARGEQQVETAIKRMRNLFEYSRDSRPPFSAFDLERKFDKAMAATVADGASTGVAAAVTPAKREPTTEERRERERQRQARFQVRKDAWLGQVEELARTAPREEVRKYADEARAFCATLPIWKNADPDRKRQMVKEIALQRFGEARGLPAPIPT